MKYLFSNTRKVAYPMKVAITAKVAAGPAHHASVRSVYCRDRLREDALLPSTCRSFPPSLRGPYPRRAPKCKTQGLHRDGRIERRGINATARRHRDRTGVKPTLARGL